MPNPHAASRWLIALIVLLFLVCADHALADCKFSKAPGTSQATVYAVSITTTCDPQVALTWAGLTCAEFTDPTCQAEFFEYCVSSDNITCDTPSIVVYPVNQYAGIAGTGAATISDLEFYSTYYFFVRAGNCMGNSSWMMTDSLTVYPEDLPERGTSDIIITQGDECQMPRTLTFAWTPFQNMNPLRSEDYYEYCVTSSLDPECHNWTSTRIMTGNANINGTGTYFVSVTAVNCFGESNDTLTRSVDVSSPTLPNASGGSVILQKQSVPPNCMPQLYAAGVFPNFFPIGTNHYEYCFGVNSTCDLQNVTNSTLPTAYLSGLKNDTSYFASFRLANCMGSTGWINSNQVHVSGLFPDGSECCEPQPFAPSVSLSEMDPCIAPRQARISFGSPLLSFRYSYQYCLVNSEVRPQNCSDAEVFVTTDESATIEIQDNNTYWAVARTANCAGNSSWAISSSIFAGTNNFPKIDSNTTVEIEAGSSENERCLESLHALWEGFHFEDNRPYVGPYEVCLSSTNGSSCDVLDWTTVKDTQFDWDVCGDATYVFQVRASNCEGKSDLVSSEPLELNITACKETPQFNTSTLEISADMLQAECNGTNVFVTVNITTTLDSNHNNTSNVTGFTYCIVSQETSQQCLFTGDWTDFSEDDTTLSWTFNVTFNLGSASIEEVYIRVRPFNCMGVSSWNLIPVEVDLPHDCDQAVSVAPSSVIFKTLSTMAVIAATIGAFLLL